MAKAKPNNSANQAYLLDVEPENLFNADERAAEKPANGNGKGGAKNGKNKGLEPPNLGKAIRLKTPDFSDPSRAPSCLEIDFPIGPLAPLAIPEATSPGVRRRPEYNSLKWFARRGHSVFRTTLLSAALEAPNDAQKAASFVWEHFYCNHQKAGSFKRLKVLDPFMGGGTTVLEASRLGFQVTGIDLNPVAWFVTKNEVACSDPAQVKALFDHIEAEVKPLIQPFYTTTCPRGHKGRWIDVRTERPAPDALDPIDLPPTDRKHYRWEGPEVLFTFWAKHGPCRGSQGKPCGHRTPIFRSPVIAEKKLSTKFIPLDCPHCGHHFNAELGETRMAPGTERVVVENEPPFTELSQTFAQMLSDYSKGNADEKRERLERLLESVETESGLQCPACNQFAAQEIRRTLLNHRRAGTVGAMKKKDFAIDSHPTYMYLLIHPKWLEGEPGKDDNGIEFGGWAGADPEATAAWFLKRLDSLAFVEVRGRVKLVEEGTLAEEEAPELEVTVNTEAASDGEAGNVDHTKYGPPIQIQLSDGTIVNTDKGTVPSKSAFRCAACGTPQDILEAVSATEQTAPIAAYAAQCYCPNCASDGFTYGGRYFKAIDKADVIKLRASEHEWKSRSDNDLKHLWPRAECWDAYMMRANGGVNRGWGYTHWWKMFAPRQLLVHAQLMQSVLTACDAGWPLDVAEQVLGANQQYLRNQCMFAFWHRANDVPVPHLSNDNYHPKQTTIENNFVAPLGYGNWSSCCEGVIDALESVRAPWESVAVPGQSRAHRVLVGEPVVPNSIELLCGSSTDLGHCGENTFDLAITDPPFGNNVFYGDLADFFYVWLRLPLLKWYEGSPERAYFEPERSPRAIEAVQNSVEHPDDRDEWETGPLVVRKHLETTRECTGDSGLNEGDPNPCYRREPASQFYCDTLTACWAETARVLKLGGLMAFTFHHSEDAPWVDVLEALFRAGFVLISTYPVHSDDTKGESAGFGSKKIEYDIIHVCRKRLEAPEPVSWAKMRRWVKDESRRYKELLERTHGRELLEADLRVILRGKALEFYSRHYGQVLTGDGQVLGVGEALLGINLLLDDLLQEGTTGVVRAPESAEPASRLLLSLFDDRDSMTRDELHKTLRGSGVSPDDLQARGWLRVVGTRVHVVPITERFTAFVSRGRTRKVLKTDLDQAHFLIGASMSGKLDISAELNRDSFVLKRSADAILGWYTQSGRDAAVRNAAAQALRLVEAWRTRPTRPVDAQLTLFEKLDREDA